jgi:hypothetical protein
MVVPGSTLLLERKSQRNYRWPGGPKAFLAFLLILPSTPHNYLMGLNCEEMRESMPALLPGAGALETSLGEAGAD